MRRPTLLFVLHVQTFWLWCGIIIEIVKLQATHGRSDWVKLFGVLWQARIATRSRPVYVVGEHVLVSAHLDTQCFVDGNNLE